MRIISGRYRGRRLRSIRGIRPTSERVRESYFNIIGQYFDGSKVLDLYCGTGSVGMEFLSRGASYAVFVDESSTSISIVKENAKMMKLIDRCRFYNMSANRYIESNFKEVFDYIYIDPPYKENISKSILPEIDESILSISGILTVEHSKRSVYPDFSGKLYLLKSRRLGDTVLSFYSFNIFNKENL